MQVLFLLYNWLMGLFFMTNSLHPYHVSATEIEYIAAEKKLEISSKIFTDDFERALAAVYKQKTDLSDKALKPQMTELIKKYISTHLSVGSNGKQLPLQLFGWEIDHEAVYVYTIAAAPDFNPKNISVQDTILYDLFNDQVNIIHFIMNGRRKSTRVNYPQKKAELGF